MNKKVSERKPKTKNKKPVSIGIKTMGWADLYSMYLFVEGEYLSGDYNLLDKDAKKIVKNKYEEIKSELYLRVYGVEKLSTKPSGFNMVEKEKYSTNGAKRFVVAKPQKEE